MGIFRRAPVWRFVVSGLSPVNIAARLPPDDPRHGKRAGYRAGCRCDACRDAASKYNRDKYRSRVLTGIPDNDPRHGTTAGHAAGCRCDACCSAHREQGRDRQRNLQPIPPADPRHGTKAGYLNKCRCEPCRNAFRKYQRSRKFNTTALTIDVTLALQGGVCAICAKDISLQATAGKMPSANVDHCHSTGQIRGVLCCECNTGIGKLGDNAEGVRRALAYLERFEATL